MRMAPLNVPMDVIVPAVPKVDTSPNMLAVVAMPVTFAVAIEDARRARCTFLLGV